MNAKWLRLLAGGAIALGAALPRTASAQQPATTLSDIYRLAREQNPRLRSAAALVRARSALESSAGLPPDPQVQVGIMNFSIPGLSADMPTSMAPSVQAMQMLPIGKLRLTRDIAEQSTKVAAADAEEAWWEVRSNAAMSFFEIWQADRQLQVMHETLAWLQNFQTVARAMYGAGEGRQSDVLRAGVEVARMQSEIERMAAMRTAAAAKLNAVLNRPAATAVGTVAFEPQPLALPGLDTLLAWAEKYRPMIERGRTEVRQAQKRVQLARREIWPDLTVGFQYGQRRGTADGMSAAGTERMGSFMLGFSVPVFAGQRQLKMRQEANAMEQLAAADLTTMQANVGARITELLADLDRARTLVQLYRTEVLPQARGNVESSFSSYRVGQVDFMTLVDAQMTRNQYEQELVALLAEYGTATAELEMTIGRELPRDGALLAEAK